MDDQLDKDIKNRIREVFDNYDDPSADEGWLLLREKFPEEKAKRRAVAWIWWSAAALLLLFLGFGLWQSGGIDNPESITTVKNHNPALRQNTVAQKSAPPVTVKGQQPLTIKNEHKTISQNIARNGLNSLKKPVYSLPVNTNTIAKFKRLAGDASSTSGNAFKKSETKIAGIVKKNDTVKHPAAQLPANQFAANNPNTARPAAHLPANQFAAGSPTNAANPAAGTDANKPATNKPEVIAIQVKKPDTPAKSIAAMFAQNNQPVEKKLSSDKKVRFGVYAATYFNYAKGSGNQANLGAGVTSEITLTKNLKLVTGITVAQNSLAFNSSVPISGGQNNFFASSAPAGTASGSAPGANMNVSALFSVGVISNASVPEVKNYSASLIGLDVPLNLKYEFSPGKNDIYVLAGVSSGTFINETYSYQYSYPALASPTLQQVRDVTARNSFNSFYIGKMLNFAFGIGYPVGKNRIILEPFLKYPLDGLGSQDIKFGAGGVNLKFNFSTNKK